MHNGSLLAQAFQTSEMPALGCSSALRVSLHWLFNGSSDILKVYLIIPSSDYQITPEWKDTVREERQYLFFTVFAGVEGNL